MELPQREISFLTISLVLLRRESWPIRYSGFVIYVLLTAGVVIFGVEKGIEKVSRFMMPVLVILSIAIAVYSLTLPGAMEGVKFYLLPDFSKFSTATLLGAIGQLFYSMSPGYGYYDYLRLLYEKGRQSGTLPSDKSNCLIRELHF